ncbi:MAG: 50S ribosomal protein L25 [candidate division Zixibacteria bacterium]|nr:50S ribosomal protein L25 [candidate division Zixibacteria bacterium]
MEDLKLLAEVRNDAGKGVARKLRAGGTVPAILYGLDNEPKKLGISGRELGRLLQTSGENAVLDLKIGRKRPEKVLLREVQRHPVTDDIIHVDFLRIDPSKKIKMSVPIKIVGTPEGVKAGGVMELVRRDLDISCLPAEIPAYIEVDVSELTIGDAIHVSDLSIEKMEVLTNPVRTIVTVQPPIVSKELEPAEEGEEVEAEEEVAEAEEPTEPEVITEKKKEDEGGKKK